MYATNTSMSEEQNILQFVLNWTQGFSITPSSNSSGFGGGGGSSIIAQVKWWVLGVFTPIFCVLGMAGNILAVVTWNRPVLRSSTGRFLSAQALTDFGVLLTWIVTYSVRQWDPSIDHDVVYATFFCYVGIPLYYFFVHCSVWITLAITIERYIMVCWATHAKRLCGMKQANIGITIIVLSSIVGNIPHFFMYGVGHDSTGSDVIKTSALKRTNFGTGSSAKVYGLYISCISLIAIPWFSVLFFNYKIVSKIASSNRRMLDKKTSEASLKAKKTEWQITRLLLAVTFTYLSVMGPYCLIQIANILHAAGIDQHLKTIAANITRSGYVLNSSLNFVLYCMMGRRFRRELKTMLGIKLSEADMTTNYTTSSDAASRSDTTKNSSVSIVKK